MRILLLATLLLGCEQEDDCAPSQAGDRIEVTVTSTAAFDLLRVTWGYGPVPHQVDYAMEPRNTQLVVFDRGFHPDAPNSIDVEAFSAGQLVARGELRDLEASDLTDDRCTYLGRYELPLLPP